MDVILLDHMGSDLTVSNAARVSFGKRKECVSFNEIKYGPNGDKIAKIPILDKADEKLIAYLTKHGHWTPISHCQLQFHIKAPMFVARQLGKHQVGLVWNEISRRYVDSDPEFYNPSEWRLKAQNVKQGSSSEVVQYDITDFNKSCLDLYNDLLSKNIAPEMARMILPQNIITEWYWTGSLYAFYRICNLRLAPDAQWETRQIAKMISDECEKMFPVCWSCLMKKPVLDEITVNN
jgi:thymidylate synthase (FAD)